MSAPEQSPIPASFNVAQLRHALAGTPFAGQVFHLSSIPSTNDLALANARAGARTGVWIADEQTRGRGRGSHRWHSEKGNGLYMTALVSPAVPMQSVLRLSFRAAIAVQSAIASITGLCIPDQVDIRWPNDILLNGRKCGGILIETAGSSASASHAALLSYAAVGIGVNVNHLTFPTELEPLATSLRRELSGHTPAAPAPPFRREPLAAAILHALAAELDSIASGALFDPTDYSTWISGKRVFVEPRGGLSGGYTGTTAGLDPQGFLLVRTEDGHLESILSGGLREPAA